MSAQLYDIMIYLKKLESHTHTHTHNFLESPKVWFDYDDTIATLNENND